VTDENDFLGKVQNNTFSYLISEVQSRDVNPKNHVDPKNYNPNTIQKIIQKIIDTYILIL